jgi:hypothetical protein
MSDFDDEPRGRSATGAVIIAVIFLAILGTGVGIVLGSANKKDGDDRAGGEPTPTATVTAPASDGPSPGATKPTGTRAPSGGTKTYRATSRDRCPEQTEEAAGTSMSVKRYIKTNRSEVWICSGGGKTVYQGRVLGSQFRAATSDTTLYIGSVEYEAGVFAAQNGDTRYFVGPDALRIEKNGTEISNEPVADLYEV